MNDEDLTRIQTTLAHQQQQIIDLSDMVSAQWREIDVLKQRLLDVQNRIGELQHRSGQDSSDDRLSLSEQLALDRPPHY